MTYIFNKLIGRIAENQEYPIGRNNEVIRDSQPKKLNGYITSQNQEELKGYIVNENKLGAFDVSYS